MRQLGGTTRLQAIKSQFAVGVNLTFPELKPHELQITLLSFRRSRLPNRHNAGIASPLALCASPLLMGMLDEISGRLRTAAQLEFLKDVTEVVLDGFVAQAHRRRDFLVRFSLSHKC